MIHNNHFALGFLCTVLRSYTLQSCSVCSNIHHGKTDVTFNLTGGQISFIVAENVTFRQSYEVNVQPGGTAAIGQGAQINKSQTDSQK